MVGIFSRILILTAICFSIYGCDGEKSKAWTPKIDSVYTAHTGSHDGDICDELNTLNHRELNILFDSILSEPNGVSTSTLLSINAYFPDSSFVFSKRSLENIANDKAFLIQNAGRWFLNERMHFEYDVDSAVLQSFSSSIDFLKFLEFTYSGNPYDTAISEWFDCVIFYPSNKSNLLEGVPFVNKDVADSLYSNYKDHVIENFTHGIEWNKTYVSTNLCKLIENKEFNELAGGKTTLHGFIYSRGKVYFIGSGDYLINDALQRKTSINDLPELKHELDIMGE